MIGIPLGLLYANAGEWFIHKHLLHGQGRSRKSFWSFHFHEHHRVSRKHGMLDEGYLKPLRGWNPQTKELAGLIGVAALHLPLLPLMPFFTGTVLWSIRNYHRVHKRAHVDPAWSEKNLPWHVDHHMGLDQDANWCVTKPWFDDFMGTRVARDQKPKKKARVEPKREGWEATPPGMDVVDREPQAA